MSLIIVISIPACGGYGGSVVRLKSGPRRDQVCHVIMKFYVHFPNPPEISSGLRLAQLFLSVPLPTYNSKT
jgi:hypothetical protein